MLVSQQTVEAQITSGIHLSPRPWFFPSRKAHKANPLQMAGKCVVQKKGRRKRKQQK